MRLLRYLLICFLALLFSLSAQATQNQGSLHFLTAPDVSWKDNRLTGDLKNVSISGLLEDLVKSKYYDCTVKGQLQGTISISFENLTVEEIIRKIMRNNNYDYTILSTPGVADGDNNPGIGELTIYIGDNTVRFTRVALGARVTPTPTGHTKEQLPSPAEKVPNRQSPASDTQNIIGKKKLDSEIMELLDEMLESKEISQQQYEEAVATMKARIEE